MAIDRDVLVQKLLHGLYLPAYNLVPAFAGYQPDVPAWAGLASQERHAKARALYAQAGYSDRQPLQVDLSYMTTSPDTRRVLEAITAMWRVNLGAEVRLSNSEWRVFQQDRELAKHALFWDAWVGDYPDPLTFLAMFQRTDGQNFGKYEQADYERLVARASASGDDAQRSRDYAAAEAVLNADAPFIPIYFYQSRHLLRPYVHGWQGNVMDRHLSRDLWLADGEGG
jgi:oligopeptide transport system substrate-binding protein